MKAPGTKTHRAATILAACMISAISGVAQAEVAPAPAPAPATQSATGTFTNPIIRSRDAADPWVVRFNDAYYFTGTLGDGIWIWKSPTLTDLEAGEKVQVFKPPASGPISRHLWAPEFYRFDERWYVYFTASDGTNESHRHYVLQSAGDDPLGPYELKGRVDSLDSYAIDGSVLVMPDGRRYWIYTTGSIEIAPMDSPLHADTDRRVVLTSPTEPWERNWVEGPEALIHNGQVFIVYSAGHSATPHYVLGILRHKGGEVLDPNNWEKLPGPAFAPSVGPDGSTFTTGHNCFTKSPDGTEDWLVYHAKDWRGGDNDIGFGGRTVRAQPFTWSADGTPSFGKPIPSGVPIPVPSGQR